MIVLRKFNLPRPLSKLLTLLGFDLCYVDNIAIVSAQAAHCVRRDPLNIFKKTHHRKRSKKRKRLISFLADHRRRCFERTANGAPGLSPPPTDFSSSNNPTLFTKPIVYEHLYTLKA